MHTLILGQSGTGKSALAKQLGTNLRRQRMMVLAFNPTMETGYTKLDNFGCIAADFEAHDPEKFVAEVRRVSPMNHKTFCIIDEAHEFFNRGNCAFEWVGTRGRHYGLHVIAITQRAAQINTTFRGQCSTIYIFRSNLRDTEFVIEEFWHHKITKDMLALPDGEFLKISKQGIARGNIANL